MQTLTELSLRLAMFYCLILTGYLIARYVRSAERVSRVITSLLINILLPLLILQTFLSTPTSTLLELPIVIVLSVMIHGFGFLLMFARQKMRAPVNETRGAELLCATFNNGIFLPLPLILIFIGEIGIPVMVLFSITQMPLLAIGGSLIASAYSGGKVNLRSSIKKAILFPPFLAATAGIALLLTGFNIDESITSILSFNGTLTTSLSLIAVGLGVGASFTLTGRRSIIETIAIRQLIVPLIMWVILLFVNLSSVAKNVLLLEALMPPAVLTVIYATNFGLDSERAASTVTLGTILLLPVVPFLPFILSLV